MFEAAVSKFVKSVGRESLIAVPNLDEADQCRPLQVVIKKNRRWFWQSARYEPTPFHLAQLLKTGDELLKDAPLKTRQLTTYNKTYKFSMNGKLGGKLKSLLDAELSGSDSVQIEAQFGDISKVELDEPKLLDELDNRCLNLEHDFIHQIRADDRKVLCVVVGVAKTAKDGMIHMHKEEKGSEEFDLSGIGGRAIGEDEGGSITDDKDKKLAVPKDTPLAYNVCELYVKANGQLELMLDRDSLGGWETPLDEADGELERILAKDVSLDEQMRSLLELQEEERDGLRHNTLQLCTKPQDVQTFLDLLKLAVRSDPSLARYSMKKFLDPETATSLLSMVGFKVKDSAGVEVPEPSSPGLNSLLCLFEALMELDDDETMALSKVSSIYANGIMALLQVTLEDEHTLTIEDGALISIYQEPNPAQAFIMTLGFQINGEGEIIAADDNYKEIEGAYRVMYTLWYDPLENPAHSQGWSWCNIL